VRLDRIEAREYDESDTLEIGDLRLTFGVTAHALPGCAPRVSDGRSTLFYSADTAYREHLVEHARGADLVLLESTYVEEGEELEQQGHMTGEQAGRFADAVGAKKLILTHTMPFDDENQENLRRARAVFDRLALMGVETGRLSAIGYGDAPSSGAGEGAKAGNQHVELIVQH
jgi:ribonuclease BN (tRNA processing enzyme)